VTTTTAASTSPRPTLLTSSSESSGLAQKFASLSIAEQHRNKEASAAAKRPFGTLVNRTSDTRLAFVRSKAGATGSSGAAGDTVPSVPALGSPGCPCLNEVPLLEPLVCKQVAHERLTAILFREDCLVLACQEGFVSTWARPSVLTKNGYM
jgi:WD repeat-containing protein 20